jgi:hypothetical protein
MTLILMGDWCSEENTDTSTVEISAFVKTLKASTIVLSDPHPVRKKYSFLQPGMLFLLTEPFNG